MINIYTEKEDTIKLVHNRLEISLKRNTIFSNNVFLRFKFKLTYTVNAVSTRHFTDITVGRICSLISKQTTVAETSYCENVHFHDNKVHNGSL